MPETENTVQPTPETDGATKQSNKERIKEIVAGIEDGIQKLFQSEKYFDYLRTMSRFHSYSVNNTVLIHLQMPNASVVAGFNQWKNRFGRHVKKGEKGLTIIAPTPFKKKVEEMKLDPDTNEPMYDADGKLIMEERMIEIPMFKPVKVFDVSQTDGKPLPQLSADLVGDVRQYEAFMEALRRSSPVPIEMQNISPNMDGYFSLDEQKIVVRTGMSQVQTVCATVHEIGHSMLHNREQAALTATAGTDKEAPKPKDKNTKEVEAESVSYAVCAYYGIETGSNSFGYIASWSKDKSLPELRASLETITKTANTLINTIDKHFAEICKERGITLSERTEQPAEEAPAPEPDTPERFAGDFCDYLEQLYKDNIIENPFSTLSKEELTPEIAKLLRQGIFDGVRETLTEAAKRTEAPAAASLLERLDKLTAQWEASLVYEVGDNFFATGEQDRSTIHVYKPTDPKHVAGSVIFVGPTELCKELAQKLNDGAMSRAEVQELEQRRFEEVERTNNTPTPQEQPNTEALLLLDGELYLHVQTTDEGYDYTLYNAETLRQTDGGQFPEESTRCHATNDPLEAAYREVCVREGLDPVKKEAVSIDFLDTIMEANTIKEQPDTTLDKYPLPDDSMRENELEDHGYMDGDMLPLSMDKAKVYLEKDYSIYTIVDGGQAELCFDAEEIEARPVDALFAVPREEWEQSEQFKEAVNDRMDRQEQREQAFLDHKADCFAIYQVKHTDDLRFIRYESLESLQEQGQEPEKDNYDLVYTGPLPEGATLDSLFEKFNIDHPADYRYPSMSVSDIVALKQDGVVSYHYCDSIGFQELPNFSKPENHLKNAELAMEDDANMIDGIINNGPKQYTVAELEAQVKAGQSISLMDLANAIQAESKQKAPAKLSRDPAKRPSVLARLNAAQPKKTTKQEKAPKRSAERDR